jgi:hypothetical protein
MSAKYLTYIFDTGLEAKWAAFFDLAGWEWIYKPDPIENWRPEFKATFPCGHSECGGSHTIFISVLPVDSIDVVRGHPALHYTYEVKDVFGTRIADAGALFGNSPAVTHWEMAHGAGGGYEKTEDWVSNAYQLWAEASKDISVQY